MTFAFGIGPTLEAILNAICGAYQVAGIDEFCRYGGHSFVSAPSKIQVLNFYRGFLETKPFRVVVVKVLIPCTHTADIEQVARVIHEAITTSSPKLRWIVGSDAEAMIAGRRAVSDEDYLTLGAEMTDEECDAAYRRILGLSIF